MSETKKLGDRISLVFIHPDPCWVIKDITETKTFSNGRGSLFVFSDKFFAEAYIKNAGLIDAFAKHFTWGDLVIQFSGRFREAIINPEYQKDKYYSIVPLVQVQNF